MKRTVIISLALLFFSCKISKQATTDTKTEITEQLEVKEQTTESKSENSVIELAENESLVITVFSTPDSSGRQHITSITEINRNKSISESRNSVLVKETVLAAESRKQKTESIKVVESTKTATKTFGWLYLIVGILSVGVVIVAIVMVKKRL